MLFSIFDCGQSENHYISVEDTTSSKRAGFLLFLSFTSQENFVSGKGRKRSPNSPARVEERLGAPTWSGTPSVRQERGAGVGNVRGYELVLP